MSSRRFGVSLVEMLVLIGALTVLVIIAVASIRPAMLRIGEVKNSARIAGSFQDMLANATDTGGEMLNPGLPRDLSRPGRWHYFDLADSPERRASTYSSLRDFWHRGLANWAGEQRDTWHAAEGPAVPEDVGESFWGWPPDVRASFPTRFIYSYTMFTEADIWSGEGPALPEGANVWLDHAKYVHYEEIAFPARKGVLVYLDPPAGSRGVLVAFADGSSAWLDPVRDLLEGAYRPGGQARITHPVIGTVDGYRGMDR